jgi:hypothetical protein
MLQPRVLGAQFANLMITTTATLPGDLSSSVLEHLRRFDTSSREVVRWAGEFVAPTHGRLQVAAARVRIVLLTNQATRHAAKVASDLAEQVIWLRGLRATIEDSTDDFGKFAVELLEVMESLQESMRGARVAFIKMKATLANATNSPNLRAQRVAAYQRLIDLEGQAYAALEGARWAVLEREADEDVKAGRVGATYSSAADMMASLDG